MKIHRLFAASFLFLLILSAPLLADEPASEFYPAKVKDISDRRYEPAVIQLLDNAKESIVMSMYIIKAEDKGPVRLLVKDLEEALDRGVSVEIYINTKPGHGMPTSGIIGQLFQPLVKKGAKVYKFTPDYLLHDKLIIVDSRYVVTGSTNWSVAALKTNYESADLIDSPELAKAKLIRLRNFPLAGDKKEENERPDRPKGLEPLPKGAIVEVSSELLNNKGYFAQMMRRMAGRAMDMYLLLLAESARTGEKEFFVPLEGLAVTLGVSPEWTDTAMRRQMIKVLKALEEEYRLIDVNFSYGKDAWVELKELPGGTFTMAGDFFNPGPLVSKNQPVKFVLLIKALLEAEGESIESASIPELSRRFGISQFSLRKGLREVKEKETKS